MEAPKILRITGPFERTKNEINQEYLAKETQKQTQVVETINSRSDDSRKLSYLTVYPELRLEEKLVGMYDPWSMQRSLVDLFPFYEVILCSIDMQRCSGTERFSQLYGCSYEQFLQLVEMGKVIPMLDSNRYADSKHYEFFRTLLKRGVPCSHRTVNLLRGVYLGTMLNQLEISTIHTKAMQAEITTLAHVLGQGYAEPIPSIINILVQRAAQRGDHGLAFLFIEYIAAFFRSKGNSSDPWLLIGSLEEIDS